MSNELTLPAPVKLNLFLHITGQRADGMHNLQTVFQLLDAGDEIHLTPSSSPEIILENPLPGIANEDNLLWKAAHQLQQHTQCHQGVRIAIEKNTPMGAGLGGGSSDAASTLLGLNRLWQTGLSIDSLCELGQDLGADVPVFIRGHSAWAEGIGEQLTPLELPTRWYLVLTPESSVSTASIFRHPELTRNTPPIKIRAFLEGAPVHNDCQPIVEALFPPVKQALDWLDQFAPSRMTGTGSSVFAAFDDQSEAEQILKQRPGNCSGFIARGINRSPVLEILSH